MLCNAIALCETFPGVRHVELNTSQFPCLFDSTLHNGRACRPIELWMELESLTLYELDPEWLEPNQFSAWLVDRQSLGLRKLHVKLKHLSKFDGPGQSTDTEFLRLYAVLKETCTLELENFWLTVPRMNLYMPVNSRLRVVSTFPYSLYMSLACAGANNRTYGRHCCSIPSRRHQSWLITCTGGFLTQMTLGVLYVALGLIVLQSKGQSSSNRRHTIAVSHPYLNSFSRVTEGLLEVASIVHDKPTSSSALLQLMCMHCKYHFGFPTTS